MLAGQQQKPPTIRLPSPPKPASPPLESPIALQDVLSVKRELDEATLSPSPLGQAYYDALDLEDEDDGDDYYGCDDDDEGY